MVKINRIQEERVFMHPFCWNTVARAVGYKSIFTGKNALNKLNSYGNVEFIESGIYEYAIREDNLFIKLSSLYNKTPAEYIDIDDFNY